MDNCEYNYKGKNFNSKEELNEELDKKKIDDSNSASDVLLNKYLDRDTIFELIQKVKKEYVPKRRSDSDVSKIQLLTNDEPNIEGPGIMSIQQFLDSPGCVIDGKPLVTQMNNEDFINQEIDSRSLKNPELPKEEIRKEVEKEISNWDIIDEDAISLHTLFTARQIGNKNSSVEEFEEYAKDKLTDRLKDIVLIDDLYNNLQNLYINIAGEYPNRKMVRNVNLKSKIENLGIDLIGHIDYLFIDRFGQLHLYKFKTSRTDPSEWSRVKKEKYIYDLAFLKQMLANNGINVKNITLDIVPVKLDYNEDYTKINKINILNPINYNLSDKGNEIMSKYFNKVKTFIKNKVVIPNISDDFAKNADSIIENIFPTLNVKSDGIARSVVDWIKIAPESTGEQAPLVIRTIGEPDHAYDVIIDNKVYPIKSAKPKVKNEEIFKIVKDHLNELDDGKNQITQQLKNAIDESKEKGFPTFSKIKGFNTSSSFLSGIFYQYIHKELNSDEKSKESDWELIEELLKYNIFIFKNKNTDQIDIITLSSLNLNTEANIKQGTTNLLGVYKYDSQIKMLDNQFGNVETIRTLILLNELLPIINNGNLKLGNIKIISPVNGGMSRNYSIEHITKEYLNTIIKVVKDKNPDLPLKNNFKGNIFSDQMEILINEYNTSLLTLNSHDKNDYDSIGFTKLISSETKSAQLIALKNILQNLRSQLNDGPDAEKKIINMVNDAKQSNQQRLKARLYILASNAYQQISGEYLNYEKPLNSIDVNIFTAPTVPNQNIQIVVNNFLTTVDNIASEIESEYNTHFRRFIMDYYKEIGYTPLQNSIIGNQAMQYERLYQLDEFGNKKMEFKNPYSEYSDLTSSERKFLKKALFQFYRIHNVINGYDIKIDPDDTEKMKNFISKYPGYLDVPLIRASGASKWQNKDRLKNAAKNVTKIIQNPKRWYSEFLENLSDEEQNQLEEDLGRISLSNMFEKQKDPNIRRGMIESHGSDYFETNVENILIEYLAAYIRTQKMNDMLIGTKSLLLQLEIMSDDSGKNEVINKEIKYIKDYLKINVFKKPIMEQNSQKIVGLLQPLRTFISYSNLAGNVVSYFRDNLNGFSENFMRSIIKFQTDITINDVRKAYQYVIPNSMNNSMNITILSKLCLKYRLSNTDLARITERLKTGRSGVFNIDNWAYATLRSPDFMNRMVLFVAKCMHDGSWEAYSIKNDTLIYDWKKDKRFELYAKGDKSNLAEYNKQRSLYLSKVREWNNEHPTDPLEVDEDNFYNLPSPYSDKEILSIKNVGNNIYGSYDKSTRAMGEHVAIGWFLGMYTTWMNGIWNTWFMKPGEYNISERKIEQETDENGNLLYFDEYGGQTTENTGVPIIKHVPMIMQGVYYTFKDLFHVIKNKESIKKYLDETDSARENLRKGLSDLLMQLLYLILIKCALTGSYKDYKKEMKNNPVIQNLLTEILYKSSSRAFDSFLGPINIIQYLGENLNPPIYQIPVKLIVDSGKFIFGDKTFMSLVTGNFAIMRAYRDTYNAYQAKQN